MLAARRQLLRHFLLHHEPFDAQEWQHRTAILRLLDGDGDPFSRVHFDPGHVTASAFVLSPDRQSLLLIFHSKLQRWLQPGGHVDPDDPDIVAAARREVKEEVGLHDLPILPEFFGVFDVDVHEIPARKNDPQHKHYDVRFAMQAPSLDFQAGSDAHAGRWVRLQDVSELESDASVLRAVNKLRKRL